MLRPGTQIGNYVIEQELGCGGMARIYRVRHAVLGTQHALKVLEPAYRERSELRARFLSEAMIGAKLHHPHIVRVTDTISTPEVAGIVMELVTGPNLETYIRSLSKPPSAATIRALFVPVLEAVAEAHRQGIVHRDGKPPDVPSRKQDRTDLGKRCEKSAGRSNSRALMSRFFWNRPIETSLS